MNERRLEPTRERTQFIGSSTAPRTTHDHDGSGRVDLPSEFVDLVFARNDLGARLQGRDA